MDPSWHGGPENYETILKGLGDAVIATDGAGRVELLNPAAEALSGWTDAEARGCPLAEVLRIVNEETRENVEDPVARVLREGGAAVLATHALIIAKDGAERPIAGGGAPLRDESGAIIGVVLAFRDQTEERAAQRALRESERQYRELVENANSAIIRWDRDGKITFFNEFAQAFFGYRADEAVGRHVSLLTPERESNGKDLTGSIQDHAEHPERYVDNITENVVRDGRRVWMAWTHRPILDDRGEVAEILAIGSDISERKRAEAEFRRLAARNEALLGSVPDIIMEVDNDKVYRWANPAGIEFFGAGVIGREAADYFEGEQNTYYQVRPLFEGDENTIYLESWQRRRDGEKRLLAWWCRVLKDADGKVSGALSTARDITGPKQAEEALSASETRYRRLFESAKDGILILDAETGTVIDVNPFLIKLLGFSHDHFMGKRLWELGFFKDIVANEDHFVQLQQKEYIRYEDLPLETAGGRRTEVEFVSNVYRVNHHKVIQCNIRDISERKRAERALRENEERYRDLVENSHDMICTHDLAGNLQSVNEAVARSLGYSPEALIKMNLRDLLAPKHRPQFEPYLAMIKEQGQAQGIMRIQNAQGEARLWEYHNTLRTKDLAEPIVRGMAHDVTERVRAEKALRASEEKYRRHFVNASDTIYSLDRAGTILDMSPSVVKNLGYRPEELIGKDFKELNLLTPASLKAAVGDAIRVFAGETVEAAEYEFIARDGSRRFGEVSGSPVVVEDEVVAVIAVARDVTDRKRAEAALRKSEERYRIIAENMSDTVWLMDMNFKSTYISPSVIRTRGFTLEELQAMPLEKHFSPASMQIVARAMAEELTPERLGQGDLNIERTLILESLRKDGSFFWSEISLALIRGQDGKPEGFVGVGRDITERKQAEAAARESEEKYRIITDNVSDMVWLMDMNLQTIYLSPSMVRTWGYSLEEFQALPLEKNFSPASMQIVAQTMAEELAPERLGQPDLKLERTMELETRRKDGSYFWNEVTVTLVRDREGKPAGFVGIGRDISERKRAEAEREKLRARLAQAQKLESVGRLAGGVAHDFNNQLSVIMTYAEAALQGTAPSDPLYPDLQEILAAAQRSADLTRQLLAFARKQTVAPKVLDLNDAVAGSLKMLRRLIGEDLDLAWLPGAELWPIKIDPTQVDQLLANLCVNARDAVAGVGKVTIETENVSFDQAYCADHAGCVPGDYVLLAVSDDGGGMSQDVVEQIFEPFFTTKEIGKGTGLGLATVYGVVKQNEGFINVYSEPGQGTTIKLYLPRHVGGRAESPLARPEETLHGRGETVLLVEDEAAILKVGIRILEHLGYRVLAAASPAQAIQLAASHPGKIHLILTDVVMPEMNGRELAGKIQAIQPGIKCLYMSGYTANVIAHRGVLDEGMLFIPKPFSINDLAAKVREALDT